MASKLVKVVSAIGTLGAAGTAVAGLFVFDLETGVLNQVKLGSLVVFDRRRRAARKLERLSRKHEQRARKAGP